MQWHAKTSREVLQRQLDKRAHVSEEIKHQHALALRDNRLMGADNVLKSEVDKCKKVSHIYKVRNIFVGEI